MALEKQLVPISFDAKMDTKTDPKLNPGLTRVIDMFRKRSGEYRVRYGYSALPSTELNSNTWNENTHITSFRDELVAISNDGVMSLSDNLDKWVERSSATAGLSEFEYATVSIDSLGYAVPNITKAAFCQGFMTTNYYVVIVGVETVKDTNATIYIHTFDNKTKTLLKTDSSVSIGIVNRVDLARYTVTGTVVGDSVYYTSLSRINKYDASTFTYSFTALTTASITSTTMELILGSFYVAITTASSFKIEKYNTSLALTDSVTLTTAPSGASTGVSCICFYCEVGGEDRVVAVSLDSDKKANGELFDTDLTSISNSAAFVTISTIPGRGRALTYVGNNSFNVGITMCYYIPGVSFNPYIGEYLTSIPYSNFVDGYGIVIDYNDVLNSDAFNFYLVKTNGLRMYPIGAVLLDSVFDPQTPDLEYSLFHLNTDLAFTALKATSYTSNTSTPITYQLNTAYVDLSGTSVNNNTVIIPGGILSSYDGATVYNTSFLSSAIYCSISQVAGSITADTYYYYLLYRYVDANGNATRSRVTALGDLTGLASKDHVLAITPSQINIPLNSNRYVYVDIYRASATNIIPRYVTSQLFNTNEAINVTISANDSEIAENEILYTYGGELEADPIFGASFVKFINNRAFIVKSDNPYRLYYSKSITNDYGLEFSQFLVVEIFEGSGSILAIEAIDDTYVVFKESGILYFSGEFANDIGVGQNFTEPRQLAGNLGIESIRSIAKIPQGIIFKSNRGFYLIDRGLNLQYIGVQVESYNSLTISAAVLVEDFNQVRFTSTSGTCLVYDYEFGEWYVWTNIPAISATVWDGKFVYATTTGSFYIENVSSYTDNGTVITPKVETGWMSFGGLQGFQRVYKGMVLGEYRGAHSLKISVATDFKPYYDEQFTVATSTYLTGVVTNDNSYYGNYATGTTDSVYQFSFKPKNQKCESMRFLIEGNFSTGNEGFTISGLSLEVGLKQGIAKISQKNMS